MYTLYGKTVAMSRVGNTGRLQLIGFENRTNYVHAYVAGLDDS